MGIRNGKKTTTKNIARIGKHSELLKITNDPLTYAKEQVKKYNEKYQNKTAYLWKLRLILLKRSKRLTKLLPGAPS